jgi:hypothetical protein
MRFPNDEVLKRLRECYPTGSRVELLLMDDIQAPPIGTKGTVLGVDNAGSIMVRWDNGSGLSVAYGADQCRSLVPDFTKTVRDQILSIRDSGETNMLDIPMVQRLAFDHEYYELVSFIEDHRKSYAAFIMKGEF